MTIKLDLSKGLLNSYRLGSSFKPEVECLNHQKCFKEGFAVYSTSALISSILICFQEGYEGFSVFKGDVLFNEIMLNITIDRSLEYFNGIFGKPYEFWCDEVEQCAQYSINKYEIEIVWNIENQSRLTYLSISLEC